jgi:type I restriction enzyme S subunit
MSSERATWFGGELPRGWQIMSLRSAFDERTEKGGEIQDEYLSLTAKDGVIPYEEKGDVGNKAPEDMSKCKKVSPGDFVLNSMNFGIGSFGVSRYEGVCSSVYLVLKPKEQFNTRYLERIFELPSFQKYAQSLGNGILAHRAAFGWDKMRAIQVPIPPRRVQDAIVRILDRELELIDDLIFKQDELSALLQERRKKLISDTLIRGLDSRASMTASKYEWLQKYPDHWSLSKIASLHKFNTGGTPASGNESFYDGEHLWATIGDLVGKEIFSTKQTLTSDGVASASMSKVPRGSLLFSFKLSVGQVAIAGADMYTNEAIAAFEPNPNVDLAWAFYAYAEFIPHFTSWNIYGARLMNQELIRSARIPLPPLEEQRAIANFLDTEVSKIDTLVAKAMQIKEMLLQRRNSLIFEAVTGKLDLQGKTNG